MDRPSSHRQAVQVIDYRALSAFCDGSLDQDDISKLLEKLEAAYGPGGLGILTMKNVPQYISKRKRLLKFAQKIARLSSDELKAVADPESKYQIGWSHGIETLENGTPDLFKGSFYANPNFNDPLVVYKKRHGVEGESESEGDYKMFMRSNVWPEKVPGVEEALLDLGNLVTEVGVKLAKLCDEYISRHFMKEGQREVLRVKLSEMIDGSVCNKGRLLHYFPTNRIEQLLAERSDVSADTLDPEKWCGVHCDHCVLTGLCRAVYLDPAFNEVSSSDPVAGLYIVTKGEDSGAEEKVKISIPEDHIGFQLGQVAQLISNNFLRATPHLVRAPSPQQGKAMNDISRNTFAVFLQPHWNQKLTSRMRGAELMEGLSDKEFKSGITFGEFSENMVQFYHRNIPAMESKL